MADRVLIINKPTVGVGSTDAGDLTTGTLPAGRLPAHTGDVTSTIGSAALTIATVNADVGTFANATVTVNAKGQVTAIEEGTGGGGTPTTDASELTTGILPDGRMPNLTGDVTTVEGAVATTLATVNANVGSFTNANITVNAKGLITAASDGTAGSGGASLTLSVASTGHGFVVEDVLYNNNGTWAKAQANASGTSVFTGVVSSVADANNFTVTLAGAITLSGKTQGLYYLSAATAGLLTATAPTGLTEFLVPVLYAASATAAYVIPAAPATLALPTVAEGGTGVATLTGIVKGNGTSAFSAATAETDYVTPTGTGTLSGKKVSLNSDLGTDDTYEGVQIVGETAGATIAQWEAVYLADAGGGTGSWMLADANGTNTYPARGLAVAAYSSSNAATILVQGIVRNDAWAWTPGGNIYLSTTAGGLTQTAPSTSGDKIQIVGYALWSDAAYFNFNGSYLTVT
jgi:hypothetical protein